MPVPGSFRRIWVALDRLAEVRPTPWGAVITARGMRDVWDLNYARVDADRPVRIEEIEDELLPALRAVRVTVEHVVSLAPEAHGGLFEALKARGHAAGWDVILERQAERGPVSDAAVEELRFGHEVASAFADLLREAFEVQPDAAITQLVLFARDVQSFAGKRWFGVRDTEPIVAMGSMIVHEGTAYVDDVATLPRSRGRGFASAIVARILDEADAAGASRVYLLADPGSPRVVAMYERLGFREVGRLASTRGPTPDA